jgi:hypothetical protein
LEPAASGAIPALIEALSDGDADVRYNVAQALMVMGTAALPAIPALIRVFTQDTNPEVRESAIWGLDGIANDPGLGDYAPQVAPLLMNALRNENEGIRSAAAATLGDLVLPNPDEVIAALKSAADNQDEDTAFRGLASEAVERLLSQGKGQSDTNTKPEAVDRETVEEKGPFRSETEPQGRNSNPETPSEGLILSEELRSALRGLAESLDAMKKGDRPWCQNCFWVNELGATLCSKCGRPLEGREEPTVTVEQGIQSTQGKLFEDLNDIKERAGQVALLKESYVEEMSRYLLEELPDKNPIEMDLKERASLCLSYISEMPEMIRALEVVAEDAPAVERHQILIGLVYIVRADASIPDSTTEMCRLIAGCNTLNVVQFYLNTLPAFREWFDKKATVHPALSEVQHRLAVQALFLWMHLSPKALDRLHHCRGEAKAIVEDLQMCAKWDALDPEVLDKRIKKLIENPLLNGPVLDRKDILASLPEDARKKIVECSSCEHHRDLVFVSSRLSAQFHSGPDIADAIVTITKEELRLQHEEAQILVEHLKTGVSEWGLKPMMHAYCGEHEDQDMYEIEEIKNSGGQCDSFEFQKRAEPVECQDCVHFSPSPDPNWEGNVVAPREQYHARVLEKQKEYAAEVIQGWIGRGFLVRFKPPWFLDHCSAYQVHGKWALCEYFNLRRRCPRFEKKPSPQT